MSLRQIPILVLTCVSLAGFECVPQRNAEAYVALMAGQKARPLNGTFNNVPVLPVSYTHLTLPTNREV